MNIEDDASTPHPAKDDSKSKDDASMVYPHKFSFKQNLLSSFFFLEGPLFWTI